jgi:amylosucrase
MGMMFYIDNFAGNLKGVKRKLDYLEDLGVNYIHLMPFLDNVEGKSDGGYAVADFRKVKEELGTMEDLEALTTACRKRGISVCMDFVMNHTSDEHEWAKKAKEGDGEYMSRYFFYNSREIPDQYEQTVPQVFPTTAPGNFSWCEENGHWVMTTFYPYQWDLNYGNPRVFNEMMYNFLYLANQGIDVFRVDAVPYIWKELGTDCRNRPKVHSIVRMMRLIGEVVCPGCVLLGEVVMEPQKVAPYFGTVEKPECHMLYNVTTMCTTWNTVAMRDARLLKNQLDIVYQLPKNYLFLNYLRCHDDIGWGLDFGTLSQWGMGEPAHKRFLNDYFTGKIQGSVSRGVLYNDDAVTQDARFCGTTASMCGLEAAIYERDGDKIYWAVKKILMLHAFMLSQSGIPLLYSGDEIGQLNDYSYQDDPKKAADSRYIHRGAFSWELAKLKDWDNTSQKMIYHGLQQLIRLRKDTPVFSQNADVYTYDVHDDGILGIVRTDGCQRFISLYNFADYSKTAWMEEEGEFTDLMTGDKIVLKDVEVPGNSFIWAVRSLEEDGAVASVEEAKEDESAVASVEDTKEDEGTVASV